MQIIVLSLAKSSLYVQLHQAALGLSYLHSEDFVHGDLHGGNILIDGASTACLADFGFSLIETATAGGYNSKQVHGGGHSHFRSPELLAPEFTMEDVC